MACGFGRPERWSKQVVSAQKEATRPTGGFERCSAELRQGLGGLA